MGLTVEQQRDKIRKKHDNEYLRRLKFSELEIDTDQIFEKGIYYLCNRNKIVYIGQSTINMMMRILSHYSEGKKKFTSFKMFIKPLISPYELDKLERKLIEKYKPKYNITYNPQKQNVIQYESGLSVKQSKSLNKHKR